MFWQSVFPGAGIHLGEREIYGLHGVIYFELQRALQNWIRRRHEVHRKEHQTNKTQDLVERQHFSSLIRTAIPTSTAPTTLNASLTQYYFVLPLQLGMYVNVRVYMCVCVCVCVVPQVLECVRVHLGVAV